MSLRYSSPHDRVVLVGPDVDSVSHSASASSPLVVVENERTSRETLSSMATPAGRHLLLVHVETSTSCVQNFHGRSLGKVVGVEPRLRSLDSVLDGRSRDRGNNLGDPCYPAVKGALGTKQWPTSLPTRSLRYTSFISRGRRPPG